MGQRSRWHWFENEDISTNILCRISAKTLNHLKLVSKNWFNLISSRPFVACQVKRVEPVLSGFFFQEIYQWADMDDVESINYIPVDSATTDVKHSVTNFLPESVVILSSNNGLLCCRSCFSTSQPTLYIGNPLNRQWTSASLRPSFFKSDSIALVFNPFQDPIDVFTDFKLVVVSQIQDGTDDIFCFYFDIYSSKTASWRRLEEHCQCNASLIKNKGVLVEGTLYWLTDGFQILMFDTQNEMPWLISTPIPETQFSSIPEMCIGESLGKQLCYVIICEDGVQLWVLEDHFGSMWELKVCVPLQELEAENSDVVELYELSRKVSSRLSKEAIAWIDPLAFKDGMMLMRISTNFYSYQLDARSLRKLCDVTTLGPKSMFSPIVLPYTMSLVPIDWSIDS